MANLSEALKEAYASNPVGQVIIETLEFRHPSFTDELGNPSAFRIVNQHLDVIATLEITAPVQAGQAVTFQAFAFDVDLPGFKEGDVPQLSITIDNVGRELTQQLEAATTSQEPIVVTYRPYLLTDLTGPQMDPPIEMVVVGATATLTTIQFTASMDSVNNVAFPRRQYTAADFPGLVR